MNVLLVGAIVVFSVCGLIAAQQYIWGDKIEGLSDQYKAIVIAGLGGAFTVAGAFAGNQYKGWGVTEEHKGPVVATGGEYAADEDEEEEEGDEPSAVQEMSFRPPPY